MDTVEPTLPKAQWHEWFDAATLIAMREIVRIPHNCLSNYFEDAITPSSLLNQEYAGAKDFINLENTIITYRLKEEDGRGIIIRMFQSVRTAAKDSGFEIPENNKLQEHLAKLSALAQEPQEVSKPRVLSPEAAASMARIAARTRK